MSYYLYIAGTLCFTVYGQIILKWSLFNLNVVLPKDVPSKIIYLIKLIFDPFVFSGFASAFIAYLFWMGAMTKFEITTAYPFTSLVSALIFVFGILFLGEIRTLGKTLGLIHIMLGVIIKVKY